jgi:hypothetical protein
MAIISVSGLIGSGKDTIAEYLIREHGFVKDSFAASLKDAVAAMFGWDRTMLEGATKEAREEREKVDEWWSKRLNNPKLSPRWVLQYFGTETCRRHFHDDMWLASLENRLRKTTQNIVVSDTRFPNELDMLKNAGATLIQVHRGESPDWYASAATHYGCDLAMHPMTYQSAVHPSEWQWVGYPFDHVVSNDCTKDDLYLKINSLLAK